MPRIPVCANVPDIDRAAYDRSKSLIDVTGKT